MPSLIVAPLWTTACADERQGSALGHTRRPSTHRTLTTHLHCSPWIDDSNPETSSRSDWTSWVFDEPPKELPTACRMWSVAGSFDGQGIRLVRREETASRQKEPRTPDRGVRRSGPAHRICGTRSGQGLPSSPWYSPWCSRRFEGLGRAPGLEPTERLRSNTCRSGASRAGDGIRTHDVQLGKLVFHRSHFQSETNWHY